MLRDIFIDFLSEPNDVNVPLKGNKKTGSGAGCVCQRYGSEDPDPYQHVTDPEHCFQRSSVFVTICSILAIFLALLNMILKARDIQ
jgi:hypothetical protein